MSLCQVVRWATWSTHGRAIEQVRERFFPTRRNGRHRDHVDSHGYGNPRVLHDITGFQGDAGMDRVLTELRPARERAISHRSEVQVEFLGANQFRLTEIWAVGNP